MGTGRSAGASRALAEGRTKARATARAVTWNCRARWWWQVLAVEAQVVEPAKDSVVEVKAAQIAVAALAWKRASGSGHRQGPRGQKGERRPGRSEVRESLSSERGRRRLGWASAEAWWRWKVSPEYL